MTEPTGANPIIAMLEKMLADAKAGTITGANLAAKAKEAIAESSKASQAAILAARKAEQESVIHMFERDARDPLTAAAQTANKCGLTGFTVTFNDGSVTVKMLSGKTTSESTGVKSAAGTGDKPANKEVWLALVPESVRIAAEAKLELDITAAIAKGSYPGGRQDAINSKGDAMRRSILGKLYGATWNMDTTPLTEDQATAKLA